MRLVNPNYSETRMMCRSKNEWKIPIVVDVGPTLQCLASAPSVPALVQAHNAQIPVLAYSSHLYRLLHGLSVG